MKQKHLLAALATAGILGISYGATAATVNTATATANIASAMTLSETSGLNFGFFSYAAAGDNRVVDAVDPAAATKTDSAGITDTNGGVGFAAGVFAVGGSNNLQYAVTLPAAAVTITDPVSTNTLSVSAFTHSCNAFPTCTLVTGSDTLYVGATVTVPLGTEVAGTYSGTYTVSVDYQ